MSTELNALRAVENDVPEKQMTQCRKIIISVEKGETNLSARLFEALRKMLRGIEKGKTSSDEKLEAIALLTRLKKANRNEDRSEVESAETPTSADTDRHPIDIWDIWRVLGFQYTRFKQPLTRSDRDILLTELVDDLTVLNVQQLILDLRRPDRGSRLLSVPLVFDAAKQYLADNGADELPREIADLEYDRGQKSFIERMRECGVEG